MKTCSLRREAFWGFGLRFQRPTCQGLGMMGMGSRLTLRLRVALNLAGAGSGAQTLVAKTKTCDN